MNQMGYSKFLAVLIFAVAMTVVPRVAVLADAQTPTLPCTASLLQCAPYLNGDKPSGSCCASMAEAVKTQMQCLCTLYTTPGMLASYGATVSQAAALTAHCNITATTCGQAPAPAPAGPTPTSTSPASTPTSYQPSPATAGKSGKSGAGRIAWAGLPCLFLLWVSMMFY